MSTADVAHRRFAAHRVRYLAARALLAAKLEALAAKYGGPWLPGWLTRGDAHELDRLRAAVDKAADVLFTHLQVVSPRDWSSGVPVAWVLEELSYEDVVRPVSEPLSVVPPVAHGGRVPIV